MSQLTPDMIDGLLIKVILNEATPEETRQTEEWIAAGPENKRYFDDFKRIWDDSRNLTVQSDVDEDRAWNDFQRRIQTQTQTNKPETSVVSFRWLRVAAGLIAVAIGIWLYTRNDSSHAKGQLALSTTNNTRVDTLADGTIVTLNRNSSLTGENARTLTLQGEAFFEVAPDKSHPFSVRSGDATIVVLGTTFNVKASDGATEVIVESGLVKVGKQENYINVQPHEKALVTAASAKPIKQDNQDDLYNYYRTNEFVCNKTPLPRLVDILNAAYNAKIIIVDSSLTEKRLTTTFSNQSLDEILTIVTKTLNLTIDKKDGKIMLKQ